MKVRTAARAVIIKDEELLVLRRTGVQGEFFVLPGGGQHHGESIQATLIRELLEECSVEVKMEQLLFIFESREYPFLYRWVMNRRFSYLRTYVL